MTGYTQEEVRELYGVWLDLLSFDLDREVPEELQSRCNEFVGWCVRQMAKEVLGADAYDLVTAAHL